MLCYSNGTDKKNWFFLNRTDLQNITAFLYTTFIELWVIPMPPSLFRFPAKRSVATSNIMGLRDKTIPPELLETAVAVITVKM